MVWLWAGMFSPRAFVRGKPARTKFAAKNSDFIINLDHYILDIPFTYMKRYCDFGFILVIHLR